MDRGEAPLLHGGLGIDQSLSEARLGPMDRGEAPLLHGGLGIDQSL
jgi:hypothetical protein